MAVHLAKRDRGRNDARFWSYSPPTRSSLLSCVSMDPPRFTASMDDTAVSLTLTWTVPSRVDATFPKVFATFRKTYPRTAGVAAAGGGGTRRGAP